MSQAKLIAALLGLVVAAGTFIYAQTQAAQPTSQESQTKAQATQSKTKGAETKTKAKTKAIRTPGRHQFVEINHTNCGVDTTQEHITLVQSFHDEVAWVLDTSSPKKHKVKIKFNHGPCDQGDDFVVTKENPSAFCTVDGAQPGKRYKYRVFDKDDQPCGPDPSVDVQN